MSRLRMVKCLFLRRRQPAGNARKRLGEVQTAAIAMRDRLTMIWKCFGKRGTIQNEKVGKPLPVAASPTVKPGGTVATMGFPIRV